MSRKFLVLFALLALVVAFAGTVPAPGGSYKVTLTQPSVVKGNTLKPGDYRLNLAGDKVTIAAGKTAVEVPVKVETAEKKYESTAIRYVTTDGKAAISEIRIGGTKTKLLFE